MASQHDRNRTYEPDISRYDLTRASKTSYPLPVNLSFKDFDYTITVKKMWSISSYKEYSTDEYARYNVTKYSDPYWKALVTYIHCSHSNTLTMYEIMRSAAESLVYDDKLHDDVDFNVIALGLK